MENNYETIVINGVLILLLWNLIVIALNEEQMLYLSQLFQKVFFTEVRKGINMRKWVKIMLYALSW